MNEFVEWLQNRRLELRAEFAEEMARGGDPITQYLIDQNAERQAKIRVALELHGEFVGEEHAAQN